MERPTLGFRSGHDLMVHGFEFCVGLCADNVEPAWHSLSLSLSLFLSLSLSLFLLLPSSLFLSQNTQINILKNTLTHPWGCALASPYRIILKYIN